MSKIVLLHGFAVNLTAPLVRPPFGPSASFSALKELVSTGEACVFRWGIPLHVPPWKLLDITFLQKLYQDEFKLIHSDVLQTRLRAFLEHERPSLIVCHSMGCSLMQSYAEKFSLRSSVKSVAFIQSDLPASVRFQSTVPLYHLYCPWDPTLFVSSIKNKSIRAGLQKSTYPNVTNILFPLTHLSNLHTSSIRDKKLVTFITTLLRD